MHPVWLCRRASLPRNCRVRSLPQAGRPESSQVFRRLAGCPTCNEWFCSSYHTVSYPFLLFVSSHCRLRAPSGLSGFISSLRHSLSQPRPWCWHSFLHFRAPSSSLYVAPGRVLLFRSFFPFFSPGLVLLDSYFLVPRALRYSRQLGWRRPVDCIHFTLASSLFIHDESAVLPWVCRCP
ncbi:hypothetical protein GQ53DRAFT_228635 [Thozetella sp. PMI_491]|nr:hypothetical protein GQ53DRAFT_228635 [Thozetella sp. PMI_491]